MDEYDEDLRDIISESQTKFMNLRSKWDEYYDNGYSSVLFNQPQPDNFVGYGYDSIYVLINAIKYIDDNIAQKYGYKNIIDIIKNMNSNDTIELLHDVINTTNFVGTTGNILLDQMVTE